MKEKVAEEIAARVKTGELIAIGTGSTVSLAIEKIAARVKREGLDIAAITTSLESAWQCQAAGIRVLETSSAPRVAWGFDGADAVDPQFRLIKGRGGALLREKLVAARCERFVVIVDDSKLVQSLDGIKIPIECIPEARDLVEAKLVALGGTEVTLREGSGKHGPVITERGNIILDVAFRSVGDALEGDLKKLLGVVECGLFVGLAHEVLVGKKDGVYSLPRRVG